MTNPPATRRVVLAVEEAGISDRLLAFATSLCDLRQLPLLAQLRLEPGLDTAAHLAFVSLVDRGGSAWRDWLPKDADQSRARILARWQRRLQTIAVEKDFETEITARKCSRREQLKDLIASGDFIVMSSSRAAPEFGLTSGRIRILTMESATEVTQVAREVCERLGARPEFAVAKALHDLSVRVTTAKVAETILVLARESLVAADIPALCAFLRERGRGLVIVPG